MAGICILDALVRDSLLVLRIFKNHAENPRLATSFRCQITICRTLFEGYPGVDKS